MSFDKAIITAAKTVAFVIGWITTAVILFRFGVASLWGSGSDLGLIGAPLVAALGILGLAYLARAIFINIRRDFTHEN